MTKILRYFTTMDYSRSCQDQETFFKKFFETLSVGDVFTYSSYFVFDEVVALAAEHNVGVEYCSPGSPEYRTHGSFAVKVTAVADSGTVKEKIQKVLDSYNLETIGENTFHVVKNGEQVIYTVTQITDQLIRGTHCWDKKGSYGSNEFSEHAKAGINAKQRAEAEMARLISNEIMKIVEPLTDYQ